MQSNHKLIGKTLGLGAAFALVVACGNKSGGSSSGGQFGPQARIQSSSTENSQASGNAEPNQIMAAYSGAIDSFGLTAVQSSGLKSAVAAGVGKAGGLRLSASPSSAAEEGIRNAAVQLALSSVKLGAEPFVGAILSIAASQLKRDESVLLADIAGKVEPGVFGVMAWSASPSAKQSLKDRVGMEEAVAAMNKQALAGQPANAANFCASHRSKLSLDGDSSTPNATSHNSSDTHSGSAQGEGSVPDSGAAARESVVLSRMGC